jgi:hypothetical protein
LTGTSRTRALPVSLRRLPFDLIALVADHVFAPSAVE